MFDDALAGLNILFHLLGAKEEIINSSRISIKIANSVFLVSRVNSPKKSSISSGLTPATMKQEFSLLSSSLID